MNILPGMYIVPSLLVSDGVAVMGITSSGTSVDGVATSSVWCPTWAPEFATVGVTVFRPLHGIRCPKRDCCMHSCCRLLVCTQHLPRLQPTYSYVTTKVDCKFRCASVLLKSTPQRAAAP
eukprot:352158-Chlamydomonas_euryale.AAC.2